MKRHFFALAVILLGGLALAKSMDGQMEGVFEDYFKIHASLVQDSTKGIDEAARSIVEKVSAIKAGNAEVEVLLGELKQAATQIQGKALKEAREDFFSLSKPLLVYLNKFDRGNEEHHRFFCPMAKKGWVQPDKETKNPYYGKAMPKCGNLIE